MRFHLLIGLWSLQRACVSAAAVPRQASPSSTTLPPPIGDLTPEIIALAGGGPPETNQKTVLTELATSAIQLLLFLEKLEVALYYEGYKNLTSRIWNRSNLPNNTVEVIAKTAAQEDVHVATLTGLLEENNQTAIGRCEYSFTANSAEDFLAIANIITPTNYGSIIGVQNLFSQSDPGIITSASEILATEVTHETFIRYAVGEIPNPAAFGTGIPPSWGFNVGHRYTIPGTCVGGVNFPLYPPLYLKGRPAPSFNKVKSPSQIEVEWDANQYWAQSEISQGNSSRQLYGCWVNLANAPVYTNLTVTGAGMGSLEVPTGLQNIAYLAITAGKPASIADLDGATLAGPLPINIS